MQGKMKAYLAEADWAPKPEYTLNEREKTEHRAMRADFVYKNVRASIQDVDIPQIADDEILIKVGACGVCGSDLSALKSDANKAAKDAQKAADAAAKEAGKQADAAKKAAANATK